MNDWDRTIAIERADEDRMQVFGWMYVSEDSDGVQIEDDKKGIMPPEVLERGAYDFVANHRIMSAQHAREADRTTPVQFGHCIESMFFDRTKWDLLGGKPASAPVSAWWVGFQITDPAIWQAVKRGDFKDFSLAGVAECEYLDGGEP